MNGEKSLAGVLVFETDGIYFYENFSLGTPLEIFIAGNEIANINFVASQNSLWQPSFWRVVFLGMWAFGRPSGVNQKTCSLEIELLNGEFVFFEIDGFSEREIRARVNSVVQGYFQNQL